LQGWCAFDSRGPATFRISILFEDRKSVSA
jgi:hypothetical protein